MKSRRRAHDPSAGGKRAAMSARGLSDAEQTEIAEEVSDDTPAALARGVEVIAEVVRTLPSGPGVYRMLNRRGDPHYVGKARNLRKRVYSYTQLSKLPRRLQRMVAETTSMEVVRTHTEVEALLLESNLIKRFMPRYNVLLRDDKSFPYILLTGDHDYPQIAKHRGAHNRQGDYYGPFASAGAVNRTLTALEKAFLLRSCSDAVFSGRTRPCLMYQIKRCSAPCVGYVDEAGYKELVQEARDFLSGRSQAAQQHLRQSMEAASERMDFEAAAVYRDRLRALAHIQSHQDINLVDMDDADVIAAHQEGGTTCVQVFFFRAGRNYGNRAYFPSHDRQLSLPEVLSSFVAQFYDNKPCPPLVLLSHEIEEQPLVAEALTMKSERKVTLLRPQRGAKRKVVEQALDNARDALARRLTESSSQRRLLDQLAERFGLESPPERIEVYDNSHIQGTDAYGAMIVAGPEGFRKNAYRKFRIRSLGKSGDDKTAAAAAGLAEAPQPAIAGALPDTVQTPGTPAPGTPGDDYAMMREVLTRRLSRALREDPERDSGSWPDLLLIDGGRGQLGIALEVLAELGLEGLPIAAIAKGPERNAGRERIFLPGQPSMLLEPNDPLLYFLQRLRDEAHRFAIGSHRQGRAKSRLRSALDEVPGIGAKRKKALLNHFGSAGAVARAGLSDLQAVEGISSTVAQKIYDHFHSQG